MQRIGRIEAANQNTFNLDRDEGELGINCDKSQVERFEQEDLLRKLPSVIWMKRMML